MILQLPPSSSLKNPNVLNHYNPRDTNQICNKWNNASHTWRCEWPGICSGSCTEINYFSVTEQVNTAVIISQSHHPADWRTAATGVTNSADCRTGCVEVFTLHMNTTVSAAIRTSYSTATLLSLPASAHRILKYTSQNRLYHLILR
jgi:hypothetical protein